MTVIAETMTGEQIVDLCRRHTLFEWSAQSAVDPIPVARAKGIYFWTPEGKRFIDFNSQLMCVNIGHGDERVIRAIQEQAATLAYANPFMATDVRARLGVKLAEITPGDIDVFFFTNGGAEANENAIRIARLFTGRHKIAARYRSYHGGTAGALTLTGDPRRWAAEPGIPGVFRIPDFYHGIQKGSDTTEEVLARTEEILELEGPKTIAAIIVEPVTGTNGILVPPDGYMQGLRTLCDKYGILLIADEVMAGFRPHRRMVLGRPLEGCARSDIDGQRPDQRVRATGCGGDAAAHRRSLSRRTCSLAALPTTVIRWAAPRRWQPSRCTKKIT